MFKLLEENIDAQGTIQGPLPFVEYCLNECASRCPLYRANIESPVGFNLTILSFHLVIKDSPARDQCPVEDCDINKLVGCR